MHVAGSGTLLLSQFSCVRLCDPIDDSPPGSPVPGIFQARTLEWVAISLLNQGSNPRLLLWQVGSLPLNYQRSLSLLLSENGYRSPYTLRVRG